MTKHFGAALSVFALAAVLSGCAGGNGTHNVGAARRHDDAATASPSTPAPATSAPAPRRVGPRPQDPATNAGQVVVDAKGMSVYLFAKDTKDSGMSACTGRAPRRGRRCSPAQTPPWWKESRPR